MAAVLFADCFAEWRFRRLPRKPLILSVDFAIIVVEMKMAFALLTYVDRHEFLWYLPILALVPVRRLVRSISSLFL